MSREPQPSPNTQHPQVTGAGLNSTSALCSFQCSAQVFLRPLATSSISRNSSQPTSSIVAVPSVDDLPGGGACFSFFLPAEAATTEVSHP